MSRRFLRPLAVGSVLAALALGHGAAQQPRNGSVDPTAGPLKTEHFTPFPAITVPMAEHKTSDGTPAKFADQEKLLHRLTAKFPRPIPPDAPPIEKIRIAQTNEAAAFLARSVRVISIC